VISPELTMMDGFGIVIGLGFVLSCGYWCADFLLVQLALAAKDMQSSVETPLVGAVAKLFFPALVVPPGLGAVALHMHGLATRYDLALPTLLGRYYSHGLLGLGITAMLASFMSGMAGNITAFNTVWTYDIYQAYLVPDHSDRHYLMVGRVTTLVETVLSIATAYIALSFNNLMDLVQLLFSFFNAPLFAIFLLGMFTEWATPWGGFWGLLAGVLASLGHYLAYHSRLLRYGSEMSANFYGAIFAWGVCMVVTTVVSIFTHRKAPEELAELVHRREPGRAREHKAWMRWAWVFAGGIAAVCIVLNYLFF